MSTFTASNGCAFAECTKRQHALGYCAGHYRQHRDGRSLTPLRAKRSRSDDFASSFWGRVRTSPLCWKWTGANDGRQGYGVVHHGGRLRRAHRVAYELFTGPIPSGMLIDHTCHNPACVRPGHLRLASSKQNAENTVTSSRNTSGFKGVRRYKDGTRWLAEVRHNGRKLHLGIFDSAQEAGEAARLKRVELFTHNDMDRQVAFS